MYDLNESEEEPVEKPESESEPDSESESVFDDEPTLADETAPAQRPEAGAAAGGDTAPAPDVAPADTPADTGAGDETAADPVPTTPDLGTCLRDAMRIYQANFLPLVVCAFLVELLTIFSLGILGGVVLGGVSVITLQALRHSERKVDIAALFSRFNQFVPLLVVFIISLAVFLLGLLLCVLPGIVVATIWMYPILLVVDRRREPMAALRESYQLVMAHGFVPHLGLCAILLVMSIGSLLVPLVWMVVSWFVTPLVWLMVASAYLQITGDRATAAQPGADPGESPADDSALCGGCGYMLRSVSSFECPECGADLREVGMTPPSTSSATQTTIAISLCVGIVVIVLAVMAAFLSI